MQHRIILPGATTLTRLISEVREKATLRLWNKLALIPSAEQRSQLEMLLGPTDCSRLSLLESLKKGPVTISGPAFNEAIERWKTLNDFGLHAENLSTLPAVRLKNLARYAGMTSVFNIARMSPQKRMAVLVAFVLAYNVEVSMRWQGRRESDNVEDRRNSSGGPSMGGPGFRLPSGKGGLILLIVVLVAGYYGVDLTGLMTGQPVSQQQSTRSISPNEDEAAKFTSVILATTEDTWGQQFEKMGKTYQQPKLVMYRGMTRTGCGAGQSIMGPFYCPADGTVYIDLSFYDDMKDKLGADGDFAQGYVIAHEVGHHVQKLLGIEPKVRQLQQNATQAEVNRLSVRMELQADCFAGVWGHSMQQQGVLETGDLEEALNAAQAIGDDRLQQQSQGRVVPDSFTHGTSQQRYSWFKRGFDSGDPAQCNTFGKSI